MFAMEKVRVTIQDLERMRINTLGLDIGARGGVPIGVFARAAVDVGKSVYMKFKADPRSNQHREPSQRAALHFERFKAYVSERGAAAVRRELMGDDD